MYKKKIRLIFADELSLKMLVITFDDLYLYLFIIIIQKWCNITRKKIQFGTESFETIVIKCVKHCYSSNSPVKNSLMCI